MNYIPSNNQPPQASQQPAPAPAPAGEYKPNIYPIMYWSLAYGVIAGFILFIVYLLSQYLTIIWFPVFLTGAVWGAFRNYKKQKHEWHVHNGIVPQPKPVIAEFREAVGDIVIASQEMMAEQQAEDAAEQQALQQQQEENLAAQAQQPQDMEPPVPPYQQPPNQNSQEPPQQR